jgi:hypothetical protein
MLVATESGLIDSAVKTLGDNDTVNSEISAVNSARLENREEQQEHIHGLNMNERDQSQVGQVGALIWNNFSHILVLNLRFIYGC